jgi:hypothetical protein
MNRLHAITLTTVSFSFLGACAEAAPTRSDAGRDAAALPADDAFVAPGTDAFVAPGTDAFVPGADADGIATPPDATHRTTLPALEVAPGGYLVIAMNIDPPAGSTETPVGPVSPCPITGVDSCLQTSYGIGRTGDTIVLFAPDGSTEIARVEYVGDLMGATQTHCRFPNATGDFTTCAATPGAANSL